MAAALHTRTLNPLPFDALEPKRFEDLVRQLAYDFRPWRKLEATGRAGGDDGFDARGWEIVDLANEPLRGDEGEAAEDEASAAATGDRQWLLQCKREAAIGPSKLVGYLNDISKDELAALYGIVVAAPANFSKAARDRFVTWCAEKGVSECYLWGRGELEDMLFQPKNDNLLFAYFGISLQIRKRSRQAQLRSRTTIKRKLKRALENESSVLLRDAEDTNYPWMPANGGEFGWWVVSRPELTFEGLEVEVRRHFAYIDPDGTHWDYANADVMGPGPYSDPWRGKTHEVENRFALVDFWNSLPNGQKAMLRVMGLIELDRILEVDEIGDDFVSTEETRPHIFLTIPKGLRRPPFDAMMTKLIPDNQWVGVGPIGNPKAADRVQKFPEEYRKAIPSADGGRAVGA